MHARASLAALVAGIALAGSACKKEGADVDGSPPSAPPPIAQAPTADVPAVEPPPPPAVPAPIFETPPAPSQPVATDMRGNVKGVDFTLPYAYARVERGNESIRIVLMDKPIPDGQFDCGSLEARDETFRVIHFAVPSGPQADFFRGGTVSVEPGVQLPAEGGWAVNEGATDVKILRFDLAEKVIEGEVLIAHKQGGMARFEPDQNQGAVEGTFHAEICAAENVPLEVKPSVPSFAGEPLTWTVGDKRLTVGRTYAHFGYMGGHQGSVLEIELLSNKEAAESGLPAAGDYGLKVFVCEGADGELPIGIPTTVGGHWAAVDFAELGAEGGMEDFPQIGPEDAAIVISAIGDWQAHGTVRGYLSVDMQATLPNATEGGPPIVVPIRGSGAFEAVLGGPDMVD
jgi:hypothetical protein